MLEVLTIMRLTKKKADLQKPLVTEAHIHIKVPKH